MAAAASLDQQDNLSNAVNGFIEALQMSRSLLRAETDRNETMEL